MSEYVYHITKTSDSELSCHVDLSDLYCSRKMFHNATNLKIDPTYLYSIFNIQK